MKALRLSLVVLVHCVVAVVQGSSVMTDASHASLMITDFTGDAAKIDGFHLSNHTLRTLDRVPSLAVCGEKCVLLGECRSLNYHHAGGICELNRATRTEFPGDFVEDASSKGVVYLGRASPIITEIKRPTTCLCCGNACQHGAYCLPSEVPHGYKCVCTSGWTGDYCENAIAKWSDWSDWSPCSTSCGQGRRNRSRECAGSVHTPDSCIGDTVEYRDCWNQASCAEWSAWTDAGSCSAACSCGYGTVNRVRTCRDNRTDCPGPNSETAQCKSVSCGAPWRLVGGSSPGEGRLEVYSTVLDLWGTVCSDGWERWDTDVACRTLGYEPPPAYLEPGFESLCDQGWIFHEGSCYWGSEAEVTVEYVQAAAICHQSASHLASILTSSENDFVRTAFPNLSKIWLGAHNGGEQPGTYRKSLLWSDGSFPAFRASVLLNAVPNADSLQCLAMHEEGEWLVKPPTKKKSVVCKKYPHFSLQFGTGEGAVHLAHMDCQGCEDHLNQCRHGSWHDVTSCSQAKAVGLKCSVVCPTYETNAVTDARFPFKPLNPSSLRVDFTVQTAGTIRLILSRDESLAGAVYSIVLSTTSTSGIYHHASASWHDEQGIMDVLNADAERGIWVTKADATLRLGRATESGPLLEWTDDLSESGPPDLYVGFSSRQPATWQFGSFCGEEAVRSV